MFIEMSLKIYSSSEDSLPLPLLLPLPLPLPLPLDSDELVSVPLVSSGSMGVFSLWYDASDP